MSDAGIGDDDHMLPDILDVLDIGNEEEWLYSPMKSAGAGRVGSAGGAGKSAMDWLASPDPDLDSDENEDGDVAQPLQPHDPMQTSRSSGLLSLNGIHGIHGDESPTMMAARGRTPDLIGMVRSDVHSHSMLVDSPAIEFQSLDINDDEWTSYSGSAPNSPFIAASGGADAAGNSMTSFGKDAMSLRIRAANQHARLSPSPLPSEIVPKASPSMHQLLHNNTRELNSRLGSASNNVNSQQRRGVAANDSSSVAIHIRRPSDAQQREQTTAVSALGERHGGSGNLMGAFRSAVASDLPDLVSADTRDSSADSQVARASALSSLTARSRTRSDASLTPSSQVAPSTASITLPPRSEPRAVARASSARFHISPMSTTTARQQMHADTAANTTATQNAQAGSPPRLQRMLSNPVMRERHSPSQSNIDAPGFATLNTSYQRSPNADRLTLMQPGAVDHYQLPQRAEARPRKASLGYDDDQRSRNLAKSPSIGEDFEDEHRPKYNPMRTSRVDYRQPPISEMMEANGRDDHQQEYASPNPIRSTRSPPNSQYFPTSARGTPTYRHTPPSAGSTAQHMYSSAHRVDDDEPDDAFYADAAQVLASLDDPEDMGTDREYPTIAPSPTLRSRTVAASQARPASRTPRPQLHMATRQSMQPAYHDEPDYEIDYLGQVERDHIQMAEYSQHLHRPAGISPLQKSRSLSRPRLDDRQQRSGMGSYEAQDQYGAGVALRSRSVSRPVQQASVQYTSRSPSRLDSLARDGGLGVRDRSKSRTRLNVSFTPNDDMLEYEEEERQGGARYQLNEAYAALSAATGPRGGTQPRQMISSPMMRPRSALMPSLGRRAREAVDTYEEEYDSYQQDVDPVVSRLMRPTIASARRTQQSASPGMARREIADPAELDRRGRSRITSPSVTQSELAPGRYDSPSRGSSGGGGYDARRTSMMYTEQPSTPARSYNGIEARSMTNPQLPRIGKGAIAASPRMGTPTRLSGVRSPSNQRMSLTAGYGRGDSVSVMRSPSLNARESLLLQQQAGGLRQPSLTRDLGNGMRSVSVGVRGDRASVYGGGSAGQGTAAAGRVARSSTFGGSSRPLPTTPVGKSSSRASAAIYATPGASSGAQQRTSSVYRQSMTPSGRTTNGGVSGLMSPASGATSRRMSTYTSRYA